MRDGRAGGEEARSGTDGSGVGSDIELGSLGEVCRQVGQDYVCSKADS